MTIHELDSAHIDWIAGERDALDVEVRDLTAKLRAAEARMARLQSLGDKMHDDLVLYHPTADVLPLWNEARAS